MLTTVWLPSATKQKYYNLIGYIPVLSVLFNIFPSGPSDSFNNPLQVCFQSASVTRTHYSNGCHGVAVPLMVCKVIHCLYHYIAITSKIQIYFIIVEFKLWFYPGAVLSPREHWSVFGGIFGCHTGGEQVDQGCCKYPTMNRTDPQTEKVLP